MTTQRRLLLPTDVRCLSRATSRDRVIRFTAATEDVARDGGIVLAAGWDVDNFRDAHPAFLWAHNSDGLPIGRAVRVEKKQGALVIDVEFAGEEHQHPFAETVFRLFEAGFLRCVSVGFRVLDERQPTDEERGRGAKWVATRAELLELSAVPVPSDPGAVATGREVSVALQRGAISTADAKTIRHHLGAMDVWSAFADTVERTAMKARNLEEGESAFTLTVRDAAEFVEGSFKEFTYQEDPMVAGITGVLQADEAVVLHGLAFPKDAGWTQESVEAFAAENEDDILAFQAEESEEVPAEEAPEEEPEDDREEHPPEDEEEQEEDESEDDERDGAKLDQILSLLRELMARIEDEPSDKDQLDEDDQLPRSAGPVGEVERDAPAASPDDADQYADLLDLMSRYTGKTA